VKKKKEKLTRAQRNKQSRARRNKAEEGKRKDIKKFLHTVTESKSIKKKLLKEERAKKDKADKIERLKEEKRNKPRGLAVNETVAEENPITADSVPVALTEELRKGGGIRSIVRKGDLLKDRMLSMAARGLVEKKSTRDRKIVQGKRRRGARASEQYQLF